MTDPSSAAVAAGKVPAIINGASALTKAPVFAVLKAVLFVLNLVPLAIYETFRRFEHDQGVPRAIQEQLVKIRGNRRVHLGFALIAWTRGALVRQHGFGSNVWWGVHTDDYEQIVRRWGV